MVEISPYAPPGLTSNKLELRVQTPAVKEANLGMKPCFAGRDLVRELSKNSGILRLGHRSSEKKYLYQQEFD